MKRIKNSRFYDEWYLTDSKYDVHYSKSRYYRIWLRALLMLQTNNCHDVISLGCGTGQFEHLLFDNGIHVTGVDFSPIAIEKARARCAANFICCDLIQEPYKYDARPFDAVVALELFEHIDDLKLIRNLPPGLNIVFMVPSADAPSHVRTFKTMEAVYRRYKGLIDIKYTENHSDRFFLSYGRISA